TSALLAQCSVLFLPPFPLSAFPNPASFWPESNSSPKRVKAHVKKAMKITHWTIAILSAFFIYVLAHSAWLEPYVRALHFFQALIYIAIILLLGRNPKWSYAIGISIGVFWLLLAGRGTNFVLNGFHEWQ